MCQLGKGHTTMNASTRRSRTHTMGEEEPTMDDGRRSEKNDENEITIYIARQPAINIICHHEKESLSVSFSVNWKKTCDNKHDGRTMLDPTGGSATFVHFSAHRSSHLCASKQTLNILPLGSE
jgi:hypothetical protein